MTANWDSVHQIAETGYLLRIIYSFKYIWNASIYKEKVYTHATKSEFKMEYDRTSASGKDWVSEY